MNCRDYLERLHQHLGGELPQELAQHLQNCPSCRWEYHTLRELKSLLARCPAAELSPEMAARLQALAEPLPAAAALAVFRPRLAWRRLILYPSLAGIALAVFLLAVRFQTPSPAPTADRQISTPLPATAAAKRAISTPLLAQKKQRPAPPVFRLDLREMNDRQLVEQVRQLIQARGGVPQAAPPDEPAERPPLQQIFVVPGGRWPTLRQDLQRLTPMPIPMPIEEATELPDDAGPAQVVLISK